MLEGRGANTQCMKSDDSPALGVCAGIGYLMVCQIELVKRVPGHVDPSSADVNHCNTDVADGTGYASTESRSTAFTLPFKPRLSR
jgi:hypothetical protein